MKNKEVPISGCGILSDILDRVGNKWVVLVIASLSEGTQRFNQLRRTIPSISHKMLTVTLKNLERDGLVKRTAYAEIPPRVEYELTELGLSLIPVLMQLREWSINNYKSIYACRKSFDHSINHEESVTEKQ